jgi:hypothetical protein
MEKFKAFWAKNMTNKVIVVAGTIAVGVGIYYGVKQLMKK